MFAFLRFYALILKIFIVNSTWCLKNRTSLFCIRYLPVMHRISDIIHVHATLACCSVRATDNAATCPGYKIGIRGLILFRCEVHIPLRCVHKQASCTSATCRTGQIVGILHLLAPIKLRSHLTIRFNSARPVLIGFSDSEHYDVLSSWIWVGL